jgi:hypothetical protein
MSMEFYPDCLRLQLPTKNTPVRPAIRPPRHRQGANFLKGPIPLSWLTVAAKQSGKALHVSMALWFLAGITRNRTVPLSAKVTSQFGVNRYAAYRGLKALEHAGLVSAVRHPGRLPIVTILDVPGDSDRVAH